MRRGKAIAWTLVLGLVAWALVGRGLVNYDTLYALVWGRDLAHGLDPLLAYDEDRAVEVLVVVAGRGAPAGDPLQRGGDARRRADVGLDLVGSAT